jgi:hypothetical protein
MDFFGIPINFGAVERHMVLLLTAAYPIAHGLSVCVCDLTVNDHHNVWLWTEVSSWLTPSHTYSHWYICILHIFTQHVDVHGRPRGWQRDHGDRGKRRRQGRRAGSYSL